MDYRIKPRGRRRAGCVDSPAESGSRVRQTLFALTGLVLAVLITGCATTPPKPLPPQVSLDGMRVSRLDPMATKFVIALRVRNPNPYDVVVSQLEASLVVNEERLLTGKLTAPATLPASGETRVEVEITTNFGGMANALERVTHEGKFGYDVTGSATIQGTPVTFSRKGELPAAQFLGERQ